MGQLELELPKGQSKNAQATIRKAHARVDVGIRIKSIDPDALRFTAFHDAGWASRPDGSSQGGYMVFAAHKDLLIGKEATTSMTEWNHGG